MVSEDPQLVIIKAQLESAGIDLSVLTKEQLDTLIEEFKEEK